LYSSLLVFILAKEERLDRKAHETAKEKDGFFAQLPREIVISEERKNLRPFC
jgi:hypothetical protein